MFKSFINTILGKNKNNIYENQQASKLTKSFKKNTMIFENIFKNDDTIMFREIQSKSPNSPKLKIISIDGMSDKILASKSIIEPIQNSYIDKNDTLDSIVNKSLTTSNISISGDIDKIIGSILYGDTIIIVENFDEILIVDSKGWSNRNITEPSSENVVRGPREGFVESILVNISLIRRKIQTPNLKFSFRQLGKQTNTKIGICYIEGIVNDKIVAELNTRLDKINIDSILESGYIEELIRDSPLSPFSTIGYTERPDTVAANLLEGRIGLLIDGTPIVLTLPYLFIENFQSCEDYYMNYIYSSFNRMLRWLGFFISTSIPAIYVAMATFHQEMIPTPLLLSISAARDGVPFPTIVETTLMLIVFEILREGGKRLPSPMGSTIGFVGAVVLGEAAVSARIVSSPIVIIVALTGLGNFLNPQMIGCMNLIRLSLLLLSAFLGLYGYIFGIIGFSIHLMSMRSFGIPYMLNVGDIKFEDIKDTTIRAPWWLMEYRPKLLSSKNNTRSTTAKPTPGESK